MLRKLRRRLADACEQVEDMLAPWADQPYNTNERLKVNPNRMVPPDAETPEDILREIQRLVSLAEEFSRAVDEKEGGI